MAADLSRVFCFKRIKLARGKSKVSKLARGKGKVSKLARGKGKVRLCPHIAMANPDTVGVKFISRE